MIRFLSFLNIFKKKTMASNNVDANFSKETQSVPNEIEIFEETKPSAFENMVIHSDFKPRNRTSNILRFLFLLSDQLFFKIMKLLQEFGQVKIFLSIDLEYEKPYWKTKRLMCSHNCAPKIVESENEIIEKVKELIEELLQYNENLCDLKSGLFVSNIHCATLRAANL